jgi:peptidoglycan/LPS O-acetylase OafA/YrhL
VPRLRRNVRPSTTHGSGVPIRLTRAPEVSNRTTGGVQLPYLPGLDGLRALAVIAVLLYHAGLPWMPGGFLGVEVFFVISGYLITSLLLKEWRHRGRIHLRAFWLRRARRLLPALYLLLVVTLTFAVVFLPSEVTRLRGDAIAALGYVTNWYLIFADQSYFETAGRPSLLQHLWSLAVEEQFYVVWPLLLTAGFWGAGVATRWRWRLVLFATLAGAVGSSLLMASLYQPEVDPSRLYYGTDTRASGLLIGAGLAFVWAPRWVPVPWCPPQWWWIGWLRRRWEWIAPLLLDVVGLGALGGLIWFCVQLDESHPFLFQGGLALVALTTALLIMAAVDPRTHLGAVLLGWRPLRWVGLRSYGVYLWHWPVFMVTRPELDVPLDGLSLVTLRLAATIVLAGLSYRYVETPMRTGALGRAWRTLHKAQGGRRWRLSIRWLGAAGMSMVFCVALGMAVVEARPPAPPSYLSVEAVHTEASSSTPETEVGDSTTAEKTVVGGSNDPTSAIITAKERRTTPTVIPTDTPTPYGRVTAIGDSVMVGAAGELQRAIGNNLDIDAEVGRQASTVIDILRERQATGRLGEVVVIDIGNNGTLNAEQFDEMMRVLEGVHKVVFVNVKVPRTWEQPNNEVLAEGVWRYPNTVLVDWHAASANRPDFFVDDGYHLQTEGQEVFADLIAAQTRAS